MLNSPEPHLAASSIPAAPDGTRLDFADSSFFYDLFRHSPEALAVGGPDGLTFGPVNPAYARMHGYQPGELDGQPILSVYPPECHDEVRAGVVRANRDGLYAWETLHLRKDGSVFPVAMKVRAVYGKDEQLRFRITSVQDITERRRLEDTMRQTQRLVEAIAVHSPVGISVKDRDGRYLLSNPLSDAALGVSPGDALGKTDHEIFPPHYADLFRANDLAVLASGRPQETEESMPGPDGDRTFLCLKFPLLDGAGVPFATSLIATEITERKRAQAELERSRQQLQAIADTMPDALYVYDLVEGRSVYSNREVGSLLGYAPQEIQAMGREMYRILLHPDDLERVLAADQGFRQMADGQTFGHEFRMRHKGGAYRWIRSRAAVFARGEDGQITQYIATAQDITEQREQQQRIESLNIRLRRAMQETHHRVKNNLQVIASLAEMQIEAEAGDQVGKATPDGSPALRRIVQHIHSLAALHELLTHNATLDESAGVISARDLLKKLLPLLKPANDARRLRPRVDEVFLSSRAAAAFALLVNELVSNALKHGRGDIRLTLQCEETQARLEVCDEGPGFPAGFDASLAAHTGLELIDSLVRHDLHGQVTYKNVAHAQDAAGDDAIAALPPPGARVVVTFPTVSPLLQGC